MLEKISFLAIGASAAVIVMTLWPMFQDAEPVPDAMVMDMNQTDVAVSMDAMVDMGAMHMHPLRPVSEDLPVPFVNHLVFPDAMDGYNVQIMTENFAFTPDDINREVIANEGHAHLYVNGEKITRVYGNWVHIPATLFQAGENTVSVTLNANDHSEWAVGDTAISSTVKVMR